VIVLSTDANLAQIWRQLARMCARLPKSSANPLGTLLAPWAAMSSSRAPASQRTLHRDRVLKAMQQAPRALFLTDQAGIARCAPLPEPLVIRMLESLELDGTEKALVVGAGSAYEAALLSLLALDVYLVETDPQRVQRLAQALKQIRRDNVTLVPGEAQSGWPTAAPYQAIVLGAAVPEFPQPLVDQLDTGGRAVVALGGRDAQLLTRLRRHPDSLESDTLGTCALGMLPGASCDASSLPWTERHAAGSPAVLGTGLAELHRRPANQRGQS
jgi:protein-L-isoaspartate(D-aspartate) O-methyltransferase